MKIETVISTHGYDFSAIVVCEHCGHTARLTTGYNDRHYHERVLPAMRCVVCNKDRSGAAVHTDSGVTACAI